MRFEYIGGKEFDETDLPPVVTIFGVRFFEGQPKEIPKASFKTPADYDHAITKLKGHAHFRFVDDTAGTVEVLDAPKKRGRPKSVNLGETQFGERDENKANVA